MSNDKPLSDLIPSLPENASLEDLVDTAPANTAVAVNRRLPPINLPLFTFLIGEREKCFALAEALATQSQVVYVEDFLTPIYDAIQAYLAISNFSPPIPKIIGGDNHLANSLFDLLTKHANPHYLTDRLWDVTEELNSYSSYNFVIRDAKGFDLNRFTTHYPLSKILVLNLDGDYTDFNTPPMRMAYQPSDSIEHIMESLHRHLQ